MIERLNYKNFLDVYEFLERVSDKYEDFYITFNKERIFLKRNRNLILKILKHQDIFGYFERDLKGILLIYREKGFRPYIKILTENKIYTVALIKFLFWNYLGIELYLKLKLENPLLDEFVKKILIQEKFTKYISKGKFYIKGFRGKEILLFKKAIEIPKKDNRRKE